MANNKQKPQNEIPVEAKDNDAGKKIKAKEIDTNQYITVVNGFQGRLVYKSSRTNEITVWDAFGDEQELELRELKNAKSAQKKFFSNNWFMFNNDDKWVIDYLGIGNYYKQAVSVEDFDDLFGKSPTELKKILSTMTQSQKRSVIYRASKLIEEGKIDSIKTISTLEDVLGVELMEK